MRAETGRFWDPSLLTGDSKDKTEYRVGKANKSSVLVVFDSFLDAGSVSASDFTVAGDTPVDAAVYNVKVRNDNSTREGYDGNSEIAGDSVQDVGFDRGYVFLTVASELKPNATPKVALSGDVLDVAQNEQDDGKDDDALDRIAPTIKVTIDEGKRPVTQDRVNLTIASDESVGTPTVTFYRVGSYEDYEKGTWVYPAPIPGTEKFVTSTEFTAVLSASAANHGDGSLYTVHVEATDSSGGNKGFAGYNSDGVDVGKDTDAILFEHDESIPAIDVDPSKSGAQDTFSTDDASAYVRIDFSAEAEEYTFGTLTLDAGSDNEKTYKGKDDDTHEGVTIISATLNGGDISDVLQANADGNVFLFKSSGLAIGDHELEVIAEDAAGNRHPTAQKAIITITERKPYSLKLNPGWNLVSIPGEPEDSDINVVIPPDRKDINSVLTYDTSGASGVWLSADSRGPDDLFTGTLDNITAQRAYWVRTDGFKSLLVSIPKPSPGERRVLPTIELSAGWNLVPVLDTDGDFLLDDDDKLPVATYFSGLEDHDLSAYTFNTIANRWERATEVQLGKGYWVYVSAAGVVVP